MPKKERGLFNVPFAYNIRHYYPIGLKPRTLRPLLIAAHGAQCAHCGAEAARLHVDHIVPLRVRNGALPHEMLWVYAIENTQLLCPDCHTEKGRVDVRIYPQGSKWNRGKPSPQLMDERAAADALWPLWAVK